MKLRWDVTAYGRPVMREGDIEPRAGVSTRTRLGARLWADRYRRGWPCAAKYERVEITRR
jgi:hypothetical protein